METPELRYRLESVAGSERYRQFLRTLNGRCRWLKWFLYWQEKLLAEAGVVATSTTALFEHVEPLLRICELHGVELQADPSGLTRRSHGAVTDYTKVQIELFPNTDCGPFGPGDPVERFRYGLWFCPVCRATETGWNASTS